MRDCRFVSVDHGGSAITKSMKVAVCENTTELTAGSAHWSHFREIVGDHAPDLLLLSEMPFGPWLALRKRYESALWQRSCAIHAEGIENLPTLGVDCIAGTMPHEVNHKRVNQAFLWTHASLRVGFHTKQYFPDEPGYYEARWFDSGYRRFETVEWNGASIGFLICTDVMFNEHARAYGRAGVQVLLVPRATGRASLQRWLVAMRMAAIVSGCYVLSSNRCAEPYDDTDFGGTGWIIDPRGDVLAATSREAPVATCTIDLRAVANAQREYPCCIQESAEPLL